MSIYPYSRYYMCIKVFKPNALAIQCGSINTAREDKGIYSATALSLPDVFSTGQNCQAR